MKNLFTALLVVIAMCMTGSAPTWAQARTEPLSLRCNGTNDSKTLRAGRTIHVERSAAYEMHIQFGAGSIAHVFNTGYEINTRVYRYRTTNSLYILNWLDKPNFIINEQITIDRQTGAIKEHLVLETDRNDTFIVDYYEGFCVPESYKNKF